MANHCPDNLFSWDSDKQNFDFPFCPLLSAPQREKYGIWKPNSYTRKTKW